MNLSGSIPITIVRSVARAFIEQHFKNELGSFDVIWDIFRRMIDRRKGHAPNVSQLLGEAGIGMEFAKPAVVDAVGLVVLGTVAKVIDRSWDRGLRGSELEQVVAKAGVESAASGELLAALIRHLPVLLVAARTARSGAGSGVISAVTEPQYEIWTNGGYDIVQTIEQYSCKKEQYLFWIDMDTRIQFCLGLPAKQGLKPTALNLLLFLAKHLGRRVPSREILSEVFGENAREDAPVDNIAVNRIQQQLTALHCFANRQFRQYLFAPDFERGVGLKGTFKEKYFVFARV